MWVPFCARGKTVDLEAAKLHPPTGGRHVEVVKVSFFFCLALSRTGPNKPCHSIRENTGSTHGVVLSSCHGKMSGQRGLHNRSDNVRYLQTKARTAQIT